MNLSEFLKRLINCLLFSQGFGLEFSELREYTHGFFSNVAEILDDGFTQVYIVLVTLKMCDFFLCTF